MTRTTACVLCGSDTSGTTFTLVDWIEPVGREAFSAVPRCRERQACRERVEQVLGEAWPIRDDTFPTTPAQVVEEPTAAVDEESPWLSQ